MVIGYIFGVVFSLYTACVVTRVNHSWVEIKLYYVTCNCDISQGVYSCLRFYLYFKNFY